MPWSHYDVDDVCKNERERMVAFDGYDDWCDSRSD